MKLHQQGNEIIATELRPMSKVPPGEFVLCLIERSKRFESLIKVPGYEMMNDEDDFLSYDFADILGWLPMPQYKPDATPVEPECFRSGVKAIFDYLQDRVANNYHANSDQMAELQKMNKVFEDWLSDALQEVSENDYHEWMDLHQAYAAGVEKYKRSHELYEKLRKLTPHQFAGLAEINLHREGGFDELVAKLP